MTRPSRILRPSRHADAVTFRVRDFLAGAAGAVVVLLLADVVYQAGAGLLDVWAAVACGPLVALAVWWSWRVRPGVLPAALAVALLLLLAGLTLGERTAVGSLLFTGWDWRTLLGRLARNPLAWTLAGVAAAAWLVRRPATP